MTDAELRSVKKRVMARYERYSSTSLGGMIIDCQAYLDQSRIIRLVRRKPQKTGDEQCRFVIYCEPISVTATIQEIAADLERIWLSDLRFTEEAHTVTQTNEEVALDFVTWWPEPTGAYVTGRLTVDVSMLATTPQGTDPRLLDLG